MAFGNINTGNDSIPSEVNFVKELGLVPNNDLNNATENGWYFFTGDCTNRPSWMVNGQVFVVISGDWTTQTTYDAGSETPGIRFKGEDGSWTNWQQLASVNSTVANTISWNGYERRFSDRPTSALCLVESDGKYVDLRSADSIASNFAPTTGANYVRYLNGVQICWGVLNINGPISSTNKQVTFPVPFRSSDAPRVLTSLNANIGVHIPVGVGWESSTSFTIGTSGDASTGATSWIAIGKWR